MKLENEVPSEFRKWIVESIQLIGNNALIEDIENLHECLIKSGIPEFESGEILVFLPTTFCENLLPQLNWPSIYFDCYSEEKKIKRNYQENKRYLMMKEETKKYWNENPENDIILNIVKWSSEFNAINKMLKDGGKLENVKMTAPYIWRGE